MHLEGARACHQHVIAGGRRYRPRAGENVTADTVACPNITGVARQHAAWLTEAGFDYVAVDVTNWPLTGNIGASTTTPSTDMTVIRPLEASRGSRVVHGGKRASAQRRPPRRRLPVQPASQPTTPPLCHRCHRCNAFGFAQGDAGRGVVVVEAGGLGGWGND